MADRGVPAPDLRFAIYATNGPTESVPLWLFGMSALARWLMTHAISLDDLEVELGAVATGPAPRPAAVGDLSGGGLDGRRLGQALVACWCWSTPRSPVARWRW